MSMIDTLNKTGDNLDQIANTGLEHSSKVGLDQVKISSSCSFQKKLVVESKEFTLANSFEIQNFNIIVHNEQKKGSASINTNSKEALTNAIDSAASLASYSVADEFLTLPSIEEAPKTKSLDFLLDDSLTDFSLEELQDDMSDILKTLTSDKRVAIDRFEMEIDVSRHSMCNSRGVKQAEPQSMVSWSWMGMGVDGDLVTGFDYDYDFSFSKSGYKEKAQRSAAYFSENIVKFLKTEKCPSYKGAILLSPRAVEEILTSNILFHASGRAVMDNKSKWTEKLNEKVISDKIKLIDNPHKPYFMGSTSFDSDGVPTKDLNIIEDGILKTHLHNCYTAKRVKSNTTASAGGPFGLEIATGDSSLSDLYNARPDLLLVDRFAGNTDPVSGDFSGVAKSSFLYKNGQEFGAVSETMIAGNFFQVANNILGVSKESINVHGSSVYPWILVDNVSVTGNQ